MFKFLIIFFAFITFGYSQSPYDVLLEKLEVNKQSKMMVGKMIDYFAKQRPNVSTTQWETIRIGIDYSGFSQDVKKIIEQYYTLEEVSNLIRMIDSYGIKAYKPKPEITEKMYVLGKGFGADIGKQINAKLKELGY